MALHRSAFGRGILLGAGAALLYAAARETPSVARGARRAVGALRSTASDGLIDWDWAERVAVRASGSAPALHPSASERLTAEYTTLLEEIEQPIASYTGNRLSLSNTEVQVLDRPGWIRANMASFRDLLEPVEEFYREQGETFGSPRAARLVVSTEMGLLVGYLARRVLGQYDLSLLGKEPLVGGRLYFVEPNIRQVEHVLSVPRDQFRRWIALHEATHAHEFELHPWVRGYMNATLRSYLRLLTEDLKRQSGGNVALAFAARLVENVRKGHNLINAVQTPQQRELMSRLQALMSLAEGYSNHVMNAVGRSMLPSFDLIHERVENRQRQRSQAEELFLRLTGLAMKMEQYRLGELFVEKVADKKGMPFANRAWDAAENLPSEAEIREPTRWIERMESAA